MRKKITHLLIGILLCFLSFVPLQGKAAGLETGRDCSLTLEYAQNGKGFAGLEIRIYRVAEAFSDGTFELVEPFSEYPVNIHGITAQREWKDLANTLNAYLTRDQEKEYRLGKTDKEGKLTFEELKTGLYLVEGVTAETKTGIYTFESFLTYLPTWQEDGSFLYDVRMKPKYSYEEKKEERTASVLKLWKDSDSKQRPKSITVDILKDGALWKSVELNEKNKWSYSWKLPEENARWSVVEKSVPKGYTVAVRANGTSFTLVNTKSDGVTTTKPPKTGDTAPLWLLIGGASVSGLLLLLLGAATLRGKTHEKKK